MIQTCLIYHSQLPGKFIIIYANIVKLFLVLHMSTQMHGKQRVHVCNYIQPLRNDTFTAYKFFAKSSSLYYLTFRLL